VKKISKLLPEGLSEETLKAIADEVDKTITQQVKAKAKLFESKVTSYLRLKIAEIKEHALQELAAENEMYRNAKLFEEVRSLMSLEINQKDEKTSTHDIVKANTELQEELEVLAKEFSKVLEENETLLETKQSLVTKVASQKSLLEAVKLKNKELLIESKQSPKPFKSSETARVISENVDRSTEATPNTYNEYLTEEVVDLCN
jgi:hypothetical protein